MSNLSEIKSWVHNVNFRNKVDSFIPFCSIYCYNRTWLLFDYIPWFPPASLRSTPVVVLSRRFGGVIPETNIGRVEATKNCRLGVAVCTVGRVRTLHINQPIKRWVKCLLAVSLWGFLTQESHDLTNSCDHQSPSRKSILMSLFSLKPPWTSWMLQECKYDLPSWGSSHATLPINGRKGATAHVATMGGGIFHSFWILFQQQSSCHPFILLIGEIRLTSWGW